MNKELREVNSYRDILFPFEMYKVNRQNCEPCGRGFQDLHWHEELQFTLVTKGTITIRVNGMEYLLHSSEALFINKGALHITTEMNEDGEYVSFNFPEKLLSFFGESRMDYQYVKPYTNAFSIKAYLIRKNEEWEKEILNRLYQLKSLFEDNRNFGWEYDVSVHAVCIWQVMIKHIEIGNDFENKKLCNYQERTQLMLTFIHKNYNSDISLKDIADSANISVAECGRCFRNMLHITPYDYLIKYRIKKGIDLLMDTGLSITEISENIGFNNVNHFIQSFKKSQNMTPNKFRSSYNKKLVEAIAKD